MMNNDAIRMDAEPIRLLKIDNVFKDEFDALPERVKEDYEYVEESRTYRVPDHIWAGKWRKHGPYYWDENHPDYVDVAIGGSDIAVGYDGSKLEQMGKIQLYEGQHGSNFKSVAELVYEKQGNEFEIEEPKRNNVFYVGHLEEPAIRARFKRQYELDHPEDVVEVVNDCYMYRCGIKDDEGELKYPFVLCNLDGTVYINGQKGIFEAKTCERGSEDYKLWKKGICPLKYYLQVCYYMACMNVSYGYICCKWGISENDFTYIRIDRNLDIEDDILSIGAEIAAHIKDGTTPSFEGQNMHLIFKYWRKMMGPYIPDAKPVLLDADKADAATELLSLLTEEEMLKEKLDNIKKRKEEILCTEIFPYAGKAAKVFVPIEDDIYTEIKLKEKASNIKIDEDKLAAEEPDLYKLYLFEVFNEKLFKKENKGIIEKYAHKPVLTDAKMNYCKVSFVSEENVKAEI